MYETMSDLPTIAKDLIAMFDSNQSPSHDDNSIITLKIVLTRMKYMKKINMFLDYI